MALNLDDHLLETPNSLLATLFRNLIGQILLGLARQLLATACLRWGNRGSITGSAGLGFGNRGRSDARLVLQIVSELSGALSSST
jgi:hypothetical protein